MVMGSGVEGFARPRNYPQPRAVARHTVPYHGRVVVRHPVPRYGRVVVGLPATHRTVLIKRQKYFFHSGVFYQRGPGGYVVVRAPIGAIVATIPLGFLTFAVGDMTYYYYGGVYYRKVPAGHLVVEPPSDTVVVQETDNEYDVTPAVGDQVSLTAESLDISSGPGNNHSVITRIPRGTVMVVRGHSPGWLYVELSDGTYGWIVAGFTAPLP